MKRWTMALLLTLTLVAGACGGNDDPALEGDEDAIATTTSDPGGAGRPLPKPTFEAGTTMAALQQKGKIVVGTKFDQPPVGVKNPVSQEVEGFDVEIAKLMAVGIFGGTVDDVDSKIEFIEARTPDRETLIKENRVDMVVATYSITDTRKQQVDFAGPYYIARQDVMIRADDTTIKALDDLNGKKVCSVTNSTSIKNIQDKAPRADISTSFEKYSLCAEALADKRVDAVTTDDIILIGLSNDNPGRFKVLGLPFTEERYGIGHKKGDDAFRDFLNDRIEEIVRTGEWRRAFETAVGSQAGQQLPTPPPVDRYTTAGAGTTATTGGAGGTTTTGRAGGTGATTSTTARSGSGASTTTTR